MNQKPLDYQRALLLVGFQISSFDHIKVHQHANKSIACNSKLSYNEMITIMYNYYGCESFAGIMKKQNRFGLTKFDQANCLPNLIQAGDNKG